MLSRIRFATGNSHKLGEARAALSGLLPNLEVLGHDGPEPIESGVSFLENAQIKARAGFESTGEPCFADDSGICVDVMGGAPGIFSAIWSGQRSDAGNRELLLAQLRDIPVEHRQASFVCTIALVVSSSVEAAFTGVWSGSLAEAARGNGGFGYDPIFIPDQFQVTAAELPEDLKNSISHRGMALQQLAQFLKEFN
jgi:XTP/dITP diphosphohydrolase